MFNPEIRHAYCLFCLFFYTAEKSHMTLGDLASGASYMFEVYARNERGRGRFANSLVVDTLASSELDFHL